MKKAIYQLYVLATLLLLASCSQDEVVPAGKGMATVRVSLTADPTPTRAATSVELQRYVAEVYTADGEPANVFGGGTTHHLQQETPDFAFRLDRTKNYTCLFWADNEDEGNAAYNVQDLKAVAVTEGKKANASAYYAMLTTEGFKENYTVTLHRASARVALWEKDKIEGNSELAVTYTPCATFNVETGAVAWDEPTTETFPITEAVDGTKEENGKQIAEFYLLAPTAETELATMSFRLKEKNVTTRDISNIPLQANYVTNIRGEFSSYTTKSFEVNLDNQWEDNGEMSTEKQYELSRPGDKSSDWTIYTKNGLLAWKDYYNKEVSTSAGKIPIIVSNVKLAGDIDLTGVEWELNHLNRNVFYGGIFDGQGHTISGFSGKNSFFSYVKDATIKNLVFQTPKMDDTPVVAKYINGNTLISGCTVKDCQIEATFGAVGSIGGFMYEGTVEDCHAIGGTITRPSTATASNTYIGGLIGSMAPPTDQKLAIRRCSASVKIDDQGKAARVGGLVGQSSQNKPGATLDIVASRATGDVNGDYAGGLIGNVDSHIRIIGCYATGVVNVNGKKQGSGGLIGRGYGFYTPDGTSQKAIIGCWYYNTDSQMDGKPFCGANEQSIYLSHCASNLAQSSGTTEGTVECLFPITEIGDIYTTVSSTEAQSAWSTVVESEQGEDYVTGADGKKYNLNGQGDGIAGSIWKNVSGGTPKLWWEED